MIHTIFTDLDGVIRHWNNEGLFAFEVSQGLSKGYLFDHAMGPELVQPAITGQVSHETWITRITAKLEECLPDSTAKELVAHWQACKSSIHADVLDDYRRLFPQARVVLVTNATSRLDADLAPTDLPARLDQIINSSDIGFAKPEKEFYLRALELADCRADESIFIDDSKANVDAAAGLGFQAIHFESKSKLSLDLTSLLKED